jgi:hypothetical protein
VKETPYDERRQERAEALRQEGWSDKGVEKLLAYEAQPWHPLDPPRMVTMMVKDLPASERQRIAGEFAGDEACVTLATLHAAKGSEWDHLRIVGLCEGVLPHEQALRAGELEEERRLAYVRMTRARHELALSWPRRRHGRPTGPSRFLSEAGLALSAAGPRRPRARERKAA